MRNFPDTRDNDRFSDIIGKVKINHDLSSKILKARIVDRANLPQIRSDDILSKLFEIFEN